MFDGLNRGEQCLLRDVFLLYVILTNHSAFVIKY